MSDVATSLLGDRVEWRPERTTVLRTGRVSAVTYHPQYGFLLLVRDQDSGDLVTVEARHATHKGVICD